MQLYRIKNNILFLYSNNVTLPGKKILFVSFLLWICSPFIWIYSNNVVPSEVVIEEKQIQVYGKKPNSHLIMKILSVGLGWSGFMLFQVSVKQQQKGLFYDSTTYTTSTYNVNTQIEDEKIEEYSNERICPEREEQNVTQIEGNSLERKLGWLKQFLRSQNVFVVGEQGSGKTTFINEVGKLRKKMGHYVIVLDPHYEYGSWNWADEIYGGDENGSRKYEEIGREMQTILDIIQERYDQRASTKKQDFQPVTVIADELTELGKHTKETGNFWTEGLLAIRKAEFYFVFGSHERTLSTIGAKGVANLRDNSLLELHLKSHIDPESGENHPAGFGYLRQPQNSPSKKESWKRVEIPSLDRQEFNIVSGWVTPNSVASTKFDQVDGPNQEVSSMESSYNDWENWRKCCKAFSDGTPRNEIIKNILRYPSSRYSIGKEYLNNLEYRFGSIDRDEVTS